MNPLQAILCLCLVPCFPILQSCQSNTNVQSLLSAGHFLTTYIAANSSKKKCLKGTSKHTMLLDQQKLRNHCMLHYNITECDRYLWRSNCLWTLTLADFSFFSANSQKSSIIIESSLILISYFSKEVSMKIGRLFLRKPCVLHSWPTAWKQLKSSCLVCQVFYANN